MALVTKFKSALVENSRRVIKALGLGASSAVTAHLAQAFGEDTHPAAAEAKGWKAIYAETGTSGQPVVVGFINPSVDVAAGEKRLFSTDADGNRKFYVLLKNDGTAELGGAVDNAVRYTPLNSGLQGLKTQMQAELAKIAVGLAGVGGAYAPGVLSVDISASKIDEIKTL